MTRLRLAAILLVLVPAAAAAQSRAAPLAGFDTYVAQAARDWRVPGMAVVVVSGDSVVFLKGFGVRELGRPDPVDAHTAFGAMSTTKAFTAMLVSMLADSGRVRLDEPVATYVPGFQLADPLASREVTVRDLLTHRVGFGDPWYLWSQSGLAPQEVLRRLRFVPRQTSLRARYAYNNVAYGLAGDIAARAAGSTWQALLRERILAPIGMTETWPDGRALAASGHRNVSAPHEIVDDTVRRLPASPEIVDPVAPAGSMFLTATDMAKWLRFLTAGGTVNGRPLLGRERFAELFQAQQVVPEDEFYPTARLTKPHFTAYGLGWFLSDYRGEFVAFHTGSIDGRSAIVGLLPDRRLGVAVLTNLDHSELRHALMYTVFDRYIGPGPGAGHDWSSEMRTMYSALADSAAARRRRFERQRVAGTRPSLPLERYAGTYVDSLFGMASVSHGGGRLTLRLGTLGGTLEHWHHDVFRVRWDTPYREAAYVAFSLDPDGAVGELRAVHGPLRYRRSTAAAPAAN